MSKSEYHLGQLFGLYLRLMSSAIHGFLVKDHIYCLCVVFIVKVTYAFCMQVTKPSS